MDAWVLITKNIHGVDVTVHRTKRGVDEELFEYVLTNWSGDWPWPIEGDPLTNEEAIAYYFNRNEDEWYEIHTARMED